MLSSETYFSLLFDLSFRHPHSRRRLHDEVSMGFRADPRIRNARPVFKEIDVYAAREMDKNRGASDSLLAHLFEERD